MTLAKVCGGLSYVYGELLQLALLVLKQLPPTFGLAFSAKVASSVVGLDD